MNSSCVFVNETLSKCLRELSTRHTGGESVWTVQVCMKLLTG